MFGCTLGASVKNATKVTCIPLSNDAVLKQNSFGYTKGYLSMQIVETAHSLQTGGIGKTRGSWGTQDWISV